MTTPKRVLLQPAYILHHRPYRETSLLIEALTKDYGRVGLIARGVRKSKSKLQGLLQPFQGLKISWSGRGDLGTLITAESDGLQAIINGRQLMSGFYINELLVRMLHRHDPHPELFITYSETLANLSGISQAVLTSGLNSTLHDEQKALRLFEIGLLQQLGYGLELKQDVKTGLPLQANGIYQYYLDKGPVLRQILNDGNNGSSTDINAIIINKHAERGICLHGHTLISLANNELNDELSLRESKQLMRAVLDQHIGNRPLNSRTISNKLQEGREKITEER